MKLKSLKTSEKNPRYLKDDKFKILLNKILCYPNLLRENKLSYDSSNKNTLLGGNMRFRVLNHIATKIPKNELLEYIKTAQNALGIDNELLLNNSLAIFSELQETKEIPNDFLQNLAHLSDDEKDAFVIIDNTNEGLWDFEILANEWEIDNVEWNIPIGFEDEDDSETQSDNTKNSEAKEDDFEGEVSTEPPLTKLGDLYEIGQHRLLCGDSTDKETVEKLMNGEKADMVFTDPPYNISFEGSMSNQMIDGKKAPADSANQRHDSIKHDKMNDKDFYDFILKFLIRLKENNKGAFYITFASRTLHQLLTPIADLKIKYKSIIIWIKNQAVFSGKDFKGRYEPILYGRFNDVFYGERFNEEDVWEFQRTLKNDLHPTMKPIPLISNAITKSSQKQNIVLDFFLGSGSTMVAAHQLNRKCYGLELDCKYADVIIKRMLNLDNTLTVKRNGVDVTHEYAKQGEI